MQRGILGSENGCLGKDWWSSDEVCSSTEARGTVDFLVLTTALLFWKLKGRMDEGPLGTLNYLCNFSVSLNVLQNEEFYFFLVYF